MKKLCFGILVLLLVLSLFACTAGKSDTTTETQASESTSPTESATQNAVSSRDEFYHEHQTLSKESADFNSDFMMRIDLPEVGLENVYIRQVSETMRLSEDAIGKVYLIGDDRYGGGMGTSDYYMLVTVGDKMYIKDLAHTKLSSASMGAVLFFADLDGDEDKEIILHECKDLAGGAGQYHARIYDFSGGLEEIFSSYDPVNRIFDTGYSCTFLEDNMLKVDNEFTGYSTTFEVKRENEEYFTQWWYDEEGNPKDHDLGIDSFNRFEPQDADNDGISEILCRQYTHLVGHTDYVGDAITVLKYNNETKEFYVSEAYFEPHIRNID